VIKCVVWDIDNTLLTGTYLESGAQLPAADPEVLSVARQLGGRGIVHALASRNPPSAAEYVAAVTGLPFAAAECGWGRKSDAIRRIMDELGFAPDAVAFVDDDLMERAEVAAALPGVLVLSPEEAAEAPAWPDFSPAVLTAEGRRRGEMYAERRRREDAARTFGGSRDDFLRHVGTQVSIAPAGRPDLPRLHELSVRTHQFNTALRPVSESALAGLLGSARHRLTVVRLRDQFGDDGIVGGAVTDAGGAGGAGAAVEAGGAGAAAGTWRVSLLVMSCRALGRGVLDALLAALCRQAADAGAAELLIPCLVTDRNVPLRLALAAAGFRAAARPREIRPGEISPGEISPGEIGPGEIGPGESSPGGSSRKESTPGESTPEEAGLAGSGAGTAGAPVIFRRELSGPLPGLPDWAAVTAGAP
jgi:methoxymalonate biosynthesis protein